MNDDARLRRADFVNRCERISRVLHGVDPEIQGAALANVISLWLAGYFMPDASGGIDRALTDELRTEILDEFIKLLRSLIPLSEQELLEKIAEEKKDG